MLFLPSIPCKPHEDAPSMSYVKSKSLLRSAALAYRANLSASARQSYSKQITDSLYIYLTRRTVTLTSLLVYRAMPSEVATEPLFHLPDYHIFAPITHHREYMEWILCTAQTNWKKGRFGILEPSTGAPWQHGEKTVLICPLTAFDRQGNRLGMGKGCFDYWLSKHRQALDLVIGLAFSGQEVAHIPVEVHDAPLDCIITEKEVIECPTA